MRNRQETNERSWAERVGFYWGWILAVGAALLTTMFCILVTFLTGHPLFGTGPVTAANPTSAIAPTLAPTVLVPTAVPTVVPTVAATTAPTAAPTAVPTAAPTATTQPVTVAGAPVLLNPLQILFAGPHTFQGTGTPGSIVSILVNGTSIGTTTVGADGNWKLDGTLAAGTSEIVVQAVDAAGTVLAAAQPLKVEVGQLGTPSLNVPTGQITGGPITLSGKGTPGSRVQVTVNDTVIGTTTVGANGTWELDTILSNGTQQVVVEALGGDGKVAVAAAPVSFNVTGGLGVSVTAPTEGTVLQPGKVTVNGTGAAGTVLEILDGDLVLGEATAGANNTWTADVELKAGSTSLSVREKGKDQILSRPVRVQVGTAALPQGCGDKLALNCPAWVTRSGGLTLRMRSSAAITANNVVASLPIGTEMQVEEGPTSANGFTWWRVTTKGGKQGWVAGENLVSKPD